jgi:hypothetical protein
MTFRRRSLHWLARSGALLVVAALPACSGADAGSNDDDGPAPPGGQTGEEDFGCRAVETSRLAWSEQSALGFSADTLLNMLGSDAPQSRLTWSDGGSTPLTLGIERAGGDVEFQAREYVSGNSGAELAVDCNDVVAIPVTLSFSTLDGAFAEAWPLTLLAESAARVTARVRVDPGELRGTFSVTQVDASRYDEVLLLVELTFAGDGWTGLVSGQANVAGSAGPNGSASSHPFDIASF